METTKEQIDLTTPGSETGCEPAYPTNHPVDSGIKRFITSFFTISDIPGLTDQWVRFFREDATLIMGHKVATGERGW